MTAKQTPNTQASQDNGDKVSPDSRPSEAAQIALGQAGEVIIVAKPAPGQTVEIPVAPNQTYLLDFPAEQAGVEVNGDNLVLTFDEDGDESPESWLVFVDLVSVARSGDAPVFQIGEASVDAGLLVEQAVALAGPDEVPLEQIAAGPGQTGGGSSTYSDDVGSTIDLLDGSTVIAGTSLAFETIDLDGEDVLPAAGGEGAAAGGLAGDRMNLALILDTSGSMKDITNFDGEQISRIEALDRTTERLLDEFSAEGNSQVRVHMVNFAEGVKEEATFDIVVDGNVDPDALQAAKDFVLAPGENPMDVGEDFTNYEAGVGAALGWFGDDANTLDDPDVNRTFIISDGKPNRGYAGDGDSVVIEPGSAQAAIDHVLGQANEDGQAPDTISEFDLLTGSFKGVENTMDAIGLNTSAAAMDILDQVDSDGHADNIHSSNEAVVATMPPPATAAIEGPGDDTLASSLVS